MTASDAAVATGLATPWPSTATPSWSGRGGYAGAVYVFRRRAMAAARTPGGQADGRATPRRATTSAASVAIDGNTIVVGAMQRLAASSAGACRGRLPSDRRRPTYGSKKAKLTASDRARGRPFRHLRGIERNTVVVGPAGFVDDDGRLAGSAYVFRTSDGGATYVEGGQADGRRRRGGRLLRLLRGDRRRHRRGRAGDALDGSMSGFGTTDGGATYARGGGQADGRRRRVTTASASPWRSTAAPSS